MRYVLDSSVGVKWVLTEALSDRARVLRDEFSRGLHELHAPDIFPAEVAHALTRAERQGRITPPQGMTHLTDVLTTPPQLHPYLPLLPRAFALSSRARIGVYDCLYVALAEREGCDLLTADDRLARSLAGHPIVLLSFLP
jgi:predicted nucleic acid-binding protein